MSLLRIFIVEDNPARLEVFQSWLPEDVKAVIASSVGKALGILNRDRGRVYSGIMLDHDLQEQTITSSELELSGSDIVKSISANVSRGIPVLVHSMNMSRAQGMVNALEARGYIVTRIPMDRLTKDIFLEWID